MGTKWNPRISRSALSRAPWIKHDYRWTVWFLSYSSHHHPPLHPTPTSHCPSSSFSFSCLSFPWECSAARRSSHRPSGTARRPHLATFSALPRHLQNVLCIDFRSAKIALAFSSRLEFQGRQRRERARKKSSFSEVVMKPPAVEM